MSVPPNEFARPVRIDTIGDAPRAITIEAEAEERIALARRFDLIALDRLTAELRLHRTGEIVHAEGNVTADVVQACAASGEPLQSRIAVPFSLRFVPEQLAPVPDEIELDGSDCDTLEYSGGEIDAGEAAAETLFLALDPFLRAPGADEALKAAGVLGEGEAGPFAGLKALRDKLSNQG
jgi:uncharacterized metal-binding protein YceD (DUF177 family)